MKISATVHIGAPLVKVAAIDTRFCFPQKITLLLKQRIWAYATADYVIKDPYTNTPYFKAQTSQFQFKESKNMVLTDYFGDPVWNIKASSPNKCFEVVRGKEQGFPAYLIQYERKRRKLPYLKVCFHNQVDGQMAAVTVEGTVHNRDAVIWLDVGCKGPQNKQLVARVLPYPNTEEKQSQYHLEISPNIDIAFILSLVLALDETYQEGPDGLTTLFENSIEDNFCLAGIAFFLPIGMAFKGIVDACSSRK